MNIRQLIESTNQVKNRDQASALKKKFGSIYAYDKRASIEENGRVVTISMLISGRTDFIKQGGKRTPVPYHKVSIAINIGEEGRKEYTPEELVSEIRLNYSKYANEKEYVDKDILKEVAEKPDKFFKGATVFKTLKGGKYMVVKNKISEDAPIQVWCSCSDYYWTFQYYNIQTPVKTKTGKLLGCLNLYATKDYPKVYNHRSEAGKKSKRPLRNPGRHPGMCKHLMLLLAMLMKDDVVKPGKSELGQEYELNYTKFFKNNIKERISDTEFERKLAKYKYGQSIKNDQRNLIHHNSGNKTEAKFRPEEQDLKIVHESTGGSIFNPLTQERKFKNSGIFNRGTGKFKWENR
jgi:hypothetical protein